MWNVNGPIPRSVGDVAHAVRARRGGRRGEVIVHSTPAVIRRVDNLLGDGNLRALGAESVVSVHFVCSFAA